METHVYINHREAASRAANGKSAGAFPDPCWSPPGPSVRPYSNTAYARDLDNGTHSVFICGTPVARADVSYFATSTGNEGATPAFAKGFATGAIRGKAYFKTWSQNVSFEGFGVPRHQDLMTHNHGSDPGNTPPSYFLDTKYNSAACDHDKKAMEDKCKPDPKNKHRGKGRPKKHAQEAKSAKDGEWVLDHCGPLMVQPGLGNFEEWYEEFKDIKSMVGQVAKNLQDSVASKLEKEIEEFLAKKALKFAARRGLTGWIPVIGWIISAVDAAVTAVDTYEKINEMKGVLAEVKGTVERLKEASEKIGNTLGKHADKLKDFKNLSLEEQKSVSREVMADIQSAYGTANPCLRARKCMLVPFNKKTAQKWTGQGCCPGQTGHHLLPDAMFRDSQQAAVAQQKWKADKKNYSKKTKKLREMPRDKLPTRSCWSGYTEGESPTICVEGNNQYSGSHGVIHAATAKKLDVIHKGKTEISYVNARDLVLDEISHMYGCDKKCLQSQLDAYYCGKAHSGEPGCPDCKHSIVNANSGMGGGNPSQSDDTY